MTIKLRLLLGFGLLLLLMVLISSWGYYSFTKQVALLEIIKEKNMPIEALFKMLQMDVIHIENRVYHVIASKTQERLDNELNAVDSFKADADKQISQLRDYFKEDKEILRSFDELSNSLDGFYNQGVKTANTYINNTNPYDYLLINEFYDKSKEIENTIESLNGKLNKELSIILENRLEMAELTRKLLFTFFISSFFLSFLIAYKIGKNITSPIQRIISTLHGFTKDEGDLRIRLRTDQRDEIGHLSSIFNAFLEKLTIMINNFSKVNEQVSSSTSSFYIIAEDTSRSITSQAERIGSLADSTLLIKEATMDIAKNASEVSSSVRNATDFAVKGRDVINEAIKKMIKIKEKTEDSASSIEALREESMQIDEIIQLINVIADQTNMLALNAAIEAARAGEHGRGFAVVADEVRKLSEKTSKATLSISGMIKSIRKNIDAVVNHMRDSTVEVLEGSNFIEQTGNELNGIVNIMEDVNDKITHIALSIQQHTSTTDEMNSHIEDIASLSRELADSSKKNALSAEALSDQISTQLEEVLSQFKIVRKVEPLSPEEIERRIQAVAPMMTWKDEYSVGVRKFDEEHKQLILLINKLHAAMKAQVGDHVVSEILTGLIDYTRDHFSGEEEVLNLNNYPEPQKTAHFLQHHKLVKQVYDLNENLKLGKGGVTIQVLNSLKKWLNDHIIGIDKQYGPFLNNRGIR
ncbi:methyl-accepting chemotaxis sensory transducer [Candidatus Magnetoovum chiemensis]|nr:methyl-accepting chemotaxis sensory transducer [Candidatus Magnetoovum chiemensis]